MIGRDQRRAPNSGRPLYTVNTIWSKWLPASNYQAARATDGAADFFERCGEDFNPGWERAILRYGPLGRLTGGNARNSEGQNVVGNLQSAVVEERRIV